MQQKQASMVALNMDVSSSSGEEHTESDTEEEQGSSSEEDEEQGEVAEDNTTGMQQENKGGFDWQEQGPKGVGLARWASRVSNPSSETPISSRTGASDTATYRPGS